MKHGTSRHPKIFILMRAIGITRRDACGLLELLWEFTADYAPQGDIGKFPNSTIASAVEWTGNPDELVRGLTDSCWLDPCATRRLVIHDWDGHAPEYVKKRLQRASIGFVSPTADNGGQRLPTNTIPNQDPTLPIPRPTDSPDLGKPVRAKILFDATLRSFVGIKPIDLEEWADTYPATNPELELKRMKQWLLANPKKAVKRNWRKFITNWLTRTQDQGGTKGTTDEKSETGKRPGSRYRQSEKLEA